MSIGALLGGFTGAYGDALQDERKRTRDAEDKELDTKRGLLELAIKSMQDNPANAHLVQQAYQDWASAAGAIGKNRPRAAGKAGFLGGSELPPLPFLDSLMNGQTPMFGKAEVNLPPINIGGGPGGPTATPAPQTQGRVVPGTGSDPTAFVPPPPLQPQPMVPQSNGTSRMNEAVNQTAQQSQADPFPAPHYSPGLFLSPESQANVKGYTDYVQSRMKQRGTIANMTELGASKDQIIDMLTPGVSRSPYGEAKMYQDPATGNIFRGITDKFDGLVHMAGNPEVTIPDAVPYGVTMHQVRDAKGVLHDVYSNKLPPTVTGTAQGPVDVNTGITSPAGSAAGGWKQVIGPDGIARWERDPAAIQGAQAPQAASTRPDLIENTADAAYQKQLADIVGRQSLLPGQPGYLTPEAANEMKRLAQAAYDAKTNYDRASRGGTLPDAPTSSPAPAQQGALPAGAEPANPARPWYVTSKLPQLKAGVGPAWNPPALARMRQYLEETRKSRMITEPVSDDQVAKAMTKERLRVEAGLVLR